MKQRATFAGWDFSSIWGMVENVSYPLLRTPAYHGDFNGDGVVNRTDFDVYTSCAAGSTILYDPAALPQSEPGCTLTPDVTDHIAADFDRDGDVDQDDFGVFQRCWSGASPADPTCNP